MFVKRVEVAIEALRAGNVVLLVDNANRENEADLIFPAQKITANIVNFMIRNGSGIVCLALTKQQAKKLGLELMVPESKNTSSHTTPFTVAIEAKYGITTGVSAEDRAHTILIAVNDAAKSDDIVQPGHVFPLIANDAGVLMRPGHTEGAVDLINLAGFGHAAVLCELMNKDGSMAKGKQISEFAKRHGLKIVTIDDLIKYRRKHENLITAEVNTSIPLNAYGCFQITVIKEKFSQQEHIILEKPSLKKSVLVRIHSSCTTGDLFGSLRCDCQQQLNYSLRRISEEGGILIYLNQEGRNIGLFNKIKAYELQNLGYDTVDANLQLGFAADLREYYLVANILRNKNISHIRLLTNNLHKILELKKYGNFKVKRIAIPIFKTAFNQHYLKTKLARMQHIMKIEEI